MTKSPCVWCVAHACFRSAACQALLVEVVGDEAQLEAALVVPVGRLLRLPGPKDPARASLVDAPLRVKHRRKVVFVIVRKVAAGARLAVARAVVGGARVGAVVASTNAAAVEVLGAVGRRGSPFAHDGVEVRLALRNRAPFPADLVELVLLAEADDVVVKDVVDVPIILGEFDASPTNTEPAARWKWVDELVRTASELNFACILWDNGLDHLDRDTSTWRDANSLS